MNKILIVILIVTCSGLSFFAGYLLTRSIAQPNQHFNSPVAAVPPVVIQQGDTANPTSEHPLTFEDIDREQTIFDKLMFAHTLASLSTADQLENYITRSARSRDPLFNSRMLSVFLEKYTALDPVGAIEFVDNSPELPDTRFISHVVTSWVRTDPEEAMDYFKSLTDLRLRNDLGGRLLGDPTLQGTGFADEVLEVLGANGAAVAGIMSARQLPPAMAFEEALTLEPRTRQTALQTSLVRWMRSDPEEAVARILQHQNTDERTRMLQSILNEYINIDEDAAFRFAQTHLTGNVRTEQHMLSVLAQRNPQRTLPLVEDFIARTGNISPLSGIMSTWVQQEPQAALAYIETLDNAQRTTMYQSVAYSYVHSHPVEGFQWLLSKQDEYPQVVRQTIVNSINHATVNVAERTISQLNDQQLKTQLITGIGNYKASQDTDSALDWLEQYENDPAYPVAVQNVISTMAYQNPRGAARAIEGRLDSERAAPLVGQIATNWYRANPDDAIDWVENLEAGEAKSNALSNMVMMVVQQDPDQAKRMINAIPEGRYRDNARRNAAYTMISESPDQIEEIISELGITNRDAVHMRELANNRNRASGAFARPVGAGG
jgi:hypothetical protein